MRYLLFALALLGGISFGTIASAADHDSGGGNMNAHNGECESEAARDAGFDTDTGACEASQ